MDTAGYSPQFDRTFSPVPLAAKVQAWPKEEDLLPIIHYANFYDAEPGESIGPRYVQDFQVHFVQAGRGTVTVGKNSWEIRAGDLVYYPCNVCHELHSSAADALRLICLHFLFFAPDEAIMAGAHAHYSSTKPFSYRGGKPAVPDAKLPVLSRLGLHHPARRTLEQLVLSYVADPAGRFMEKRGLLFLFLEYWRGAIASSDRNVRLDEHQIQLLERVEAHVLSHLHEDIAITDIAKSVKLQPDYLTRLFKAYSGSGLKQFILMQKLARARRLLVEHHGTVSEIAYAVGFNDPLYFSRLFTRKFGFPPSELRRQHTIC